MNNKILGLSREEVEKSFSHYGDNSLKKDQRKGFFHKFFENLSDPIIRILIVAMAVQVVFSFGHCNYFEVIGILSAILLSTTVSTLSEFKSEQAFEKLEADALESCVSVLRDGKIQKINLSKLVVGDVVYLYAGEKIPADGRIVDGKISVDQSALNGESEEVLKCAGSEAGFDLSLKSKVFRGSLVIEGSAVMEVERVGNSTYYGMVARDVQLETRKSPLKLRLEKLARQISKIGYFVAIVVTVPVA